MTTDRYFAKLMQELQLQEMIVRQFTPKKPDLARRLKADSMLRLKQFVRSWDDSTEIVELKRGGTD